MAALRGFMSATSNLSRMVALRGMASSRTVGGVSSTWKRFASTFEEDVTVEKRSDGVAVITLNLKDSPVNVIRGEHTAGFEKLVSELESDASVKAAVLQSGKKGNFIAGADINQLAACQTATELTSLSEAGQRVFNQIENMSKPIVAAVDGACLGGGFEMALACRYRVASTSSKTKFALPEVQLGLLPGAGGTVRVLDKAGAQKGLPLLLTGKQLNADQARRHGLVDMVVDPDALEASALRAAKELADGSLKSKKRKPGLIDRGLEGPFKSVLLKKAREQVMKQTKGKYPAPLAILKVVESRLNHGRSAQFKTEREEFGKLGMTPESESLISIYKAHTALKANRFGNPKHKVETVAVLGAGLMGAGVAQVTAAKGMKVLLKDRDQAGVSRGEQQIYKNLSQKVKRRRMTAMERDQQMANVVPLTDADENWGAHFKNADMIIEAVFEDLDLKKRVLNDVEKYIPEHCVFASNTSQLPIAKIAEASKRPDKVVGMHYFSPVDKMPLLEVITTDQTSKDTAASAVDVGLRQGKTVIVVKDGPGFYTTRILAPMMMESATLMLQGVPVPDLDKHLRDFGFPVGPVTLLDEVGIDVANHIAADLSKSLGDRVVSGGQSGLIGELERAGFCGRKSGKGLYVYDEPVHKPSILDKLTGKGGKPGKKLNQAALDIVERYREPDADASSLSAEEIQHRMVVRMVNEAVYCLEEGILHKAADGDIGAIFGLGFPPFLGGPFRWIDRLGSAKFLDLVNSLRDKYGDHFTPAPMLVEYAKTNRKFHE